MLSLEERGCDRVIGEPCNQPHSGFQAIIGFTCSNSSSYISSNLHTRFNFQRTNVVGASIWCCDNDEGKDPVTKSLHSEILHCLLIGPGRQECVQPRPAHSVTVFT